ncbi:Alpha/Beta hydrolase protein [Mycena sanguinolenta]|nr:Alpha/Beta hydrolase protein [Mycena sanguinolenta]
MTVVDPLGLGLWVLPLIGAIIDPGCASTGPSHLPIPLLPPPESPPAAFPAVGQSSESEHLRCFVDLAACPRSTRGGIICLYSDGGLWTESTLDPQTASDVRIQPKPIHRSVAYRTTDDHLLHATYIANTPIAVLVFLYGAAEHAGRYSDMHAAFAAQGVSVFVFDQRGFGRTALDKEYKSVDSAYGKTDPESQLEDVECAIEHVQLEFGGLPIFLMERPWQGGGLALGLMCESEKRASPQKAALAAIRGSKPVSDSHQGVTNAQYLVDPFIATPGSLRSILDMLGLGAHVLSTGYVNWPKKTAILLLHGTADPVTSCKSTKALYEKLPAEDKKLITYPDAYHELHNDPDDVREKFLVDAFWLAIFGFCELSIVKGGPEYSRIDCTDVVEPRVPRCRHHDITGT